MNYLTTVCFLRKDPIYHQTKSGGYVSVELIPETQMYFKNGYHDMNSPKPQIYAYAKGGSQPAEALLTARRGDFVNLFGELGIQVRKGQGGESFVTISMFLFRADVTENRKLVSLCDERKNRKTVTDVMNELAESEQAIEEIEEYL